jgi:hypothetical protein
LVSMLNIAISPIYTSPLSSTTDASAITCTEHPLVQRPQFRAPTCRHSPAASPCCTAAPLSTRWHTQRWDLVVVSCVFLGAHCGKLTLYDSINRAALLAKTAVDALCHVDVVSCCPPAAVHTLLGLNRDSLRRADGLAELAGNAALLSCRVSSQSVLASEAG